MDSSFGNWQSALETLLHAAKDENDLIKFKKINNNYDRVKFILEQNYLNSVPWLPVYFDNCEKINRKSKEKSLYHRNAGNELFQIKKYSAAVEAYNKSVLYAPVSSPEFGLALGNRSAALYHLGNIQDCLADIDLALSSHYPAESCYKLHLRKAQCLAACRRVDEALSELTTAEKKLQINEKHIKKKTLDLAKQNIGELKKKLSNSTSEEVKCVSEAKGIPELSYGVNQNIPQASTAVKMMCNSKEGRYLVATQDIKPGDTLIVEGPFAVVLLPDHYETHCNHCIGALTSPPLPCTECCKVRYCSETCQKRAWTAYHHTECKYIDLLHSIGIAHLSLRTILAAGASYLKEFLSTREELLRMSKSKSISYLPEVYEWGYTSVFNLVSHSEDMHVDDLFQYTLTAALLLNVIVQSGWTVTSEAHHRDAKPTKSSFCDHGQDPTSNSLLTSSSSINRDLLLLGSALLLHIQQLVCNAHAITELQVSQKSEQDVVDTKSQVRIATSIYPTASLMNHTCDPTIISSFHKEVLVVRAVQSVAAGEEIFNCYGPHVRRMKYSERQQNLRDQYFFDCVCLACVEQKDKERQFEAFKCERCEGAVTESSERYQCRDCHQPQLVAPLGPHLETAAQLFRDGLALLEHSQIAGAIQKFKECEAIRDRVLYRHHRDLAEVEDCLAQCYAMIGEFDTACQHLNRSVETTKLLHGDDSIELAYELQKLAEVLFNAKKVTLCLEVIDKALKIFCLHFGESHSTVGDLSLMKECLDEYLLTNKG